MSTALQRIVAKEFAKLRDDPKKLEKMMDTLYDIAHRKVVAEHDSDMAMVLAMLYRLTKEKPDQTQHQIVLGLMQKYKIPEPNAVKITPSRA